MQFYVHVKLGVGKGYHNFQIHEEVHVSLNLRLFFFNYIFIIICEALQKNMYKNMA